jgi:long-chain acyl-CoA synthetase
MALGKAVRQGRERHPEKRALIFEQQSWTYAQVDDITDRIGASLLQLGIQPGDRVALHFTNCPDLVFGYYACFKIGAVAVPLNTRLKGPELEYVLHHSGARLFIGQHGLFSEVQSVRSRLPSVERYYVAGDSSAYPGARPLDELLASRDAGVAFLAVPDDALAVILYTSGTTAHPKGVMHSHYSLERTIASIVEAELTGANETVGIAAPVCHMLAFGCQLLPALSLGATVVLMPRPDPETVLRSMAEHRVTVFSGLPMTCQSLLDCLAARTGEFRSLKVCLGGGDAVPVELQRRFQETFGVAITEGCGMTEVVPYSLNPVFGAKKTGSIGPPAPGVSLRLVNDRGGEAPPGEVGEVLVKSEAMMAGYWQDPEATAAALQNGWLRTGDLARRDEDGYYWFVGRRKEIIIRGGSNISPVEVEAVLYEHPAVKEAGVVGVPNPSWGEVVHAYVAVEDGSAPSEAELKQFVQERLAAYKVPEAIHFLAALPKGPTGKIHRKTLRDWAGASPPD